MKTQNPVIDNIIEAQTQAVNNWVDTTKKFQNALSGGKIQSEGQSIYNEWLEKQMSFFGGSFKPGTAGEGFAKPEEFFKNWYAQQTGAVKQITDFNQSIYNSFVNYGKSANDYTNNFSSMNNAWTNIYNNWMSALNSSFETMMKSLPNATNQDVFKKLFESNRVYFQLQELYGPAFKAWQNMDFSTDNYKKFFDAEAYKKVTEQMFGQYFNQASVDEVFQQSIKQIQNFFVGQNGLAKEYAEAFQNISKEFPQLVSGDFAKLTDLYNNMNNVFGKSFSPVLNLVTPGKDKESIEATIALMDRVAEYSVKQAQFQYHFYVTGQKAMEEVSKTSFEKLQQGATESQSFNEFYNEWVKMNEKAYADLYSSEEFSKLKSELLSVSADVKRTFEKQFENQFSVYPVVFRSEVEELHKTIYDLKKQVKALEAKLSADSVELAGEEEKTSKKRK
jgi:polyhydroxyalkanoate synthase subunit PhaE